MSKSKKVSAPEQMKLDIIRRLRETDNMTIISFVNALLKSHAEHQKVIVAS